VDLQAGYRFCNAPRFHAAWAWPERLRLGSGDAWRPPTEAELALLVAGEAGDDTWGRDVCVFAVPEHLRSLWWDLVAAAADAPPDAGPLAQAFADFAQFKRIPLPARCSFDVVLTPPGQPAAGTAGPAGQGRVVAGVNLGDERTTLVLLNLPPARLEERLGPPAEGLVERFLAACPGYPQVRLALDAGEGAWLPPGAIVLDRCPSERDVDVWLALRGE
jgi:hypothetical protein